MSESVILVGFPMLWLKHCVVTILPHEVIAIDAIYMTVLLVYG